MCSRLLPFLVMMSLIAACQSGNRDAQDVLISAAITEFGGGACEETVTVARRVGVDYERVIAGCLKRDKRSMHTLFWLSAHARFDAASSQGHSAVLGHLLRHQGDAYFGPLLAREDPEIRAAVHDRLFYDFGGGDWTTWGILCEQFPLTFAGAECD